jgi:hypothetical protein
MSNKMFGMFIPLATELYNKLTALASQISVGKTSKSGIQIHTKIVEAVRLYYEVVNKDSLVALPLSIPTNDLANAPKVELTEATILQYIQFIDSIHDFGNIVATDCIKKTKGEYVLQYMILSYINQQSFPIPPIPPLHHLDPLGYPYIPYPSMEAKCYSGFSSPGFAPLTKSVNEVEAHMLLLALKYVATGIPVVSDPTVISTNRGTYTYSIVNGDTKDNIILDFFGDEYLDEGMMNVVIDTVGEFHHIIKNKSVEGPSRFRYLLTKEGIYDPCPSKPTPQSKEKITGVYDNHVYIEHPFQEARTYYPLTDDNLRAGNICFNSNYEVTFDKIGWSKGLYSSVATFKSVNTALGGAAADEKLKEISCICNQKLHPISVPVIEKNIERYTEKINIPINSSIPLYNELDGNEKNIDKIYQAFDAFSAIPNKDLECLKKGVDFNFTLKRTGDGSQAKCVEYINKYGIKFLKSNGNKKKETDCYEHDPADAANVKTYWFKKAILVTLDRVLAAYAIYNHIPVIYTCEPGKFMILYKPPALPAVVTPPQQMNYTVADVKAKIDEHFTYGKKLQEKNTMFEKNKITIPKSGPPIVHPEWFGCFPMTVVESATALSTLITTPLSKGGKQHGGGPLEDMLETIESHLSNPDIFFKFLPKFILLFSGNPSLSSSNSHKRRIINYLQNIIFNELPRITAQPIRRSERIEIATRMRNIQSLEGEDLSKLNVNQIDTLLKDESGDKDTSVNRVFHDTNVVLTEKIKQKKIERDEGESKTDPDILPYMNIINYSNLDCTDIYLDLQLNKEQETPGPNSLLKKDGRIIAQSTEYIRNRRTYITDNLVINYNNYDVEPTENTQFIKCLYEKSYLNKLSKYEYIGQNIEDVNKNCILFFDDWWNNNCLFQFSVEKRVNDYSVRLKLPGNRKSDSIFPFIINNDIVFQHFFKPFAITTTSEDYDPEVHAEYEPELSNPFEPLTVNFEELLDIIKSKDLHIIILENEKNIITEIIEKTDPSDTKRIEDLQTKLTVIQSKIEEELTKSSGGSMVGGNISDLFKPTKEDDNMKLINFNVIRNYFKILDYYENIVCIEPDEYTNNYNTMYGIEFKNKLYTPIFFKYLIEEFIENKNKIDYRLLPHFIKLLFLDLYYDVDYIITRVYEYMNVEKPELNYESNVESYPLFEASKEYFTQLIKKLND